MPRTITCWFGRKDDPNRYSEEFTVYSKSCLEIPSFVPLKSLSLGERVLSVGEFVETKDGWISPVIAKWGVGKYFRYRIASEKYSTFRFSDVEYESGGPWFEPPVGASSRHSLKTVDSRLSKRQEKFCQMFIRIGDFKAAAIAAGYSTSCVSLCRLRSPKIQRGIVKEFKKHLEAVNKTESEFLSDRILSANSTIDRALEAILGRIEEGTASDNDMKIFEACMKDNKQLMGLSAKLLGYDLDNGASKNGVPGDVSSPWNHQLPPGVKNGN